MRVFVAALTAIAVVATLATPWPWDLLPVAALVATLGLVTQLAHRSLVEQVVLAGFVGGALFLIVSHLATSVFYGPDWLSMGPSLGLRLAVLALGLATTALPTRARS